MPLYEYTCPDDGETITLLRAMKDADAPVDDPEGRGRTFIRVHSTFAVGDTSPERTPALPRGGCPCGDPHGPCGRGA